MLQTQVRYQVFAQLKCSTKNWIEPENEAFFLNYREMAAKRIPAALARLNPVYQNIPPRPVITWDKAERIFKNWEVWEDPNSIVHRLPEHFTRRYWDNVLRDREPVHWDPPASRFIYDEDKNIKIEKENYPIVPIFPPEADEGLWGGEGVVRGYFLGPLARKLPRKLPRNWWPKLWFPNLKRSIVYSEVLDKYMSIIVTERALRKIDDHYGLDTYLLETDDIDIASKLGLKLKREILISLANGADFYEDPERKERILEKYAKFIIPLEEAEWVGLDLNEACRKLQDIEETHSVVPKKVEFEQSLVEKLRNVTEGADSEEKSAFEKIASQAKSIAGVKNS